MTPEEQDKARAVEDVTRAVDELRRSERGRKTLKILLDWLDTDGLALDYKNKKAVFTLLHHTWGSIPGTARDIIRDALADSPTPIGRENETP